MFAVKICFVVVLTGTLMNGATSRTHTLTTFRTFSTQVPNFPQYVVVNVLNGLPVYYFDSKTRITVPKQEWMSRVTEEDPQFWERNTQADIGHEQVAKVFIHAIRQLFNQSEGLHVWQRMSGCEWEDETDEIRGYYQYAFDGEDFILLDWTTATWISAKPQAFATDLKRTGEAVRVKNDLTHRCVKNLKTFLRLGEKTLMRTELPRVSLLQKSSSSPVTCHATGFYPDAAMLFWTKDGEEVYEGVDLWEILPNHDGTFQKSADLNLSSVATEDWGRYSCVFQLAGVPDDLITKLDPKLIRTNEPVKEDVGGQAAAACLNASTSQDPPTPLPSFQPGSSQPGLSSRPTPRGVLTDAVLQTQLDMKESIDAVANELRQIKNVLCDISTSLKELVKK